MSVVQAFAIVVLGMGFASMAMVAALVVVDRRRGGSWPHAKEIVKAMAHDFAGWVFGDDENQPSFTYPNKRQLFARKVFRHGGVK